MKHYLTAQGIGPEKPISVTNLSTVSVPPAVVEKILVATGLTGKAILRYLDPVAVGDEMTGCFRKSVKQASGSEISAKELTRLRLACDRVVGSEPGGKRRTAARRLHQRLQRLKHLDWLPPGISSPRYDPALQADLSDDLLAMWAKVSATEFVTLGTPHVHFDFDNFDSSVMEIPDVAISQLYEWIDWAETQVTRAAGRRNEMTRRSIDREMQRTYRSIIARLQNDVYEDLERAEFRFIVACYREFRELILALPFIPMDADLLKKVWWPIGDKAIEMRWKTLGPDPGVHTVYSSDQLLRAFSTTGLSN